jgi:hypothetical protein
VQLSGRLLEALYVGCVIVVIDISSSESGGIQPLNPLSVQKEPVSLADGNASVRSKLRRALLVAW